MMELGRYPVGRYWVHAAIAVRAAYPARAWFAATALVLAAVAMPTPAPAVIISTADMARGFAATHEQCVSLPQTVWVGVGRYRFCIQYYLSTAGGESQWPAVFLQGDRRAGKFEARTGQFIADPRGRDVDTASLARYADLLSRRTHATAIYLARIGVDGSSGHQDMRRSVLEGMVLDQALTAIKQRHGFKGFHLVGQSGGAANIGALLAMRNDIGCAVPGSGPLALRGGASRTVMDPMLVKYNGLSGIAAIVRNRPARVLVVSDRLDRTVPIEFQSAFARALDKAGVVAEQYFVTATDDNHHGVAPFAAMALAGCIDGKSRDEISGELVRLGARMIAANKAGGAKADKTAPAPAVLAPGPAAAARAMPMR
jgi:hypothetical protein